MPITYNKIASATVGSGGAADIEFTSIPAIYTDLVIKLSSRSSFSADNDNIQLDFNGSTANRSERELFGNGASAGSASVSDMRAGYVPGATATTNAFGNSEVYIPNYTGSTNKSSSTDGAAEGNITGMLMGLHANLWSQTAAITSIKLRPAGTGANFVQYTTATLYGIKKD
jgi:hypothetical protein